MQGNQLEINQIKVWEDWGEKNITTPARITGNTWITNF